MIKFHESCVAAIISIGACSVGLAQTPVTPPEFKIDGVAVAQPGGSGGSSSGNTDFSRILFSESFENGSLGSYLSSGGFTSTHAKYSNAVAAACGSRAVSDLVTAGNDENANGWYLTPAGMPTLVPGDEIWFRVKTYIVPGADLTGTGTGLKWMRFSRGGNGYTDVYLVPRGDGTYSWRFQVEAGQNPSVEYPKSPTGNYTIQFGKWETTEFWMRLGTGTSGLLRFWKNGVFVGESYALDSMGGASIVNSVLFRTYWNGAAPNNQTWYEDAVAVAVKKAGGRDDSPYLSTDSGGRKFIGTGCP